MVNPDIKMLRDELAKAISVIQRMEKTIQEQGNMMIKQEMQITEQAIEITKLQNRLMYYEHPHNPSSKKTIPYMVQKAKKK